MSELDALESRLDYQFANQGLLKRALTHRSYHRANNERLEFLGDSIIGFLIAESLYHQFPNAAEGDLTKMRARLVRGTTLASIARELELSHFLLLGEGELKSGGFERDSILSDTMEAIFGAIYLDGGFHAIKNVVLRQFMSRLAKVTPDNIKDNKTLLQELLQKEDKPLPVYEVVKQDGKPHNLTFQVRCDIDHPKSPFYASGTSRRRAEQLAAAAAIDVIVVPLNSANA